MPIMAIRVDSLDTGAATLPDISSRVNVLGAWRREDNFARRGIGNDPADADGANAAGALGVTAAMGVDVAASVEIGAGIEVGTETGTGAETAA